MNGFDQKARGWDADPVKGERARIAAEAIRKRVPLLTGFSVLEYGCGTGLLGFALQPYASHVTLADSSSGMLDVLRKKIAASGVGNMTPLRLDLCTDPLPADRFDLICTLMTLHHILDTQRILAAFHELLAPGGCLCIVDLDKEDGSFHGRDFSGHTGFDRSEFQEKTEQAGFRVISWETVYTMTKETAQGRKTFPLFLMVAKKN